MLHWVSEPHFQHTLGLGTALSDIPITIKCTQGHLHSIAGLIIVPFEPGNYTPNIMKCVLGTVSVAPLDLGTPFLVALVPIGLGTAFLARHSHHIEKHMGH